MHRLIAISLPLWMFALFIAPTVQAQAAHHPIVAGFERFYQGNQGDAASGGRLLLNELGCRSCHAGDKGSKQAPILDEVGSRIRVGHLRRFLNDPHGTKPGTTMPDLLHGDPQRAEKVEALVHFLASTGTVRPQRIPPKAVAAGRDIYSKYGCVACHGTRKADGEPDRILPTSVPLGDLKTKYTLGSLTTFLENPLHARPSGRMPRLLNSQEAQNVATYLLQGSVTPSTGRGITRYSYYEGNWNDLPDFSKLKPRASGTGPAFDVGLARRNDDYGLRFEGFFTAPRPGNYTFTLSSDDGARLYVDDKRVVDNDGIHATTTKVGTVRLTEGVHAVRVDFFQGGGEAVLEVQVRGPGLAEQPLAELVAESAEALKKKPAAKQPSEDTLDNKPELIAQGQKLFSSLGCASCHTLRIKGTPLASTLAAPALEKLTATKGCLADNPNPGVPRYGLTRRQNQSLTAALASKAPEKTPASTIRDTMTALNCYACHSRDKVGGPQEELNKFFLTTQPEMGDEGRLPPPLDGVGAKLQTEYFKGLLDRGAHERPYMHTRMPGFGTDNVVGFIEAVGTLDKLPAIPPVTFNEPLPKVKAQARHLVGGQAFGCIKCHTFNGIKAEGVQGIDMTLMPRRLTRDWYHAYVSDPQRIRPGTRMPAAFQDGKSVLPDILGGTALHQIEAIWLYTSDGKSARLPAGMGPAFIPLTPTTSAIVYRNFISDAGPRAIGVGYPEKVNLAYDANDLRIALLWQGAFIDAARHWTDRGSGFEGPLGENVLKLASGPDFALLANPEAPWPNKALRPEGYRFLGYRLDKEDRPTFLLSVGQVRIEDTPQPTLIGKEMGFKRLLSLRSETAVPNLHYRAAVGNKIEADKEGWFRIDGSLRVKVTGGEATVRKVAGRMELVVPIRLKDGKAELIQEYNW